MTISISVPVGWRLRKAGEKLMPKDRIWNRAADQWDDIDWTSLDHASEIMDHVFVITRDLSHSVRKSKQEKRRRWKLLRE